MKSKILTTSLLASALFAGLGLAPVMAQNTSTPRIDQMQQGLSGRIQQGLASGQVTPSEAQVLYRRDREIAQRESRYKADGNASPQERQQLRSDLAGLNADVDRMMTNREVARHSNNEANTPGIDNREYNIGQRIDEAAHSGRISPQQARRLHMRERQIQRHEARLKADGVATPREREQLRRELTGLRQELDRMMRHGPRGR